MGFFDGMNGLAGGGRNGDLNQYIPTPKIIIGHVLDVCLDETSDMYKGSDTNIGAIRFRDVFGPPTKDIAKERGNLAFPADRSNYKLPLPGEQVIVYQAYTDQITPTNLNAPGFFYGSVVMNSANVTATTSPFVGVEPSLLNPLNLRSLSFTQLERRFDKKFKNIENFKDTSSKPIIHKQLRPFEGDYIIQGRYGNTIRFGGTPADRNAEDNAAWATKKAGQPGDPIITIRLSNETIKANKAGTELYDIEDINEDAASIYLTSTQEIPLKLAVPDKGNREHPLASWAYTYGISSPQVLPSETNMYDGEQNKTKGDKKSDKVNQDAKPGSNPQGSGQANDTEGGNPPNQSNPNQ